MTDKVLGCDTSHWSDTINFETMYNAGARFWITKATDAYVQTGYQYEDSKFMTFSKAAFEHRKLLAGCFHWLQASVDPKAAANFYLERYYRFPFHFPPVLDFEELSVTKTGKFSDFAWRAQVWLDHIESQTGKLPFVYTAKWFTNYFKDSLLSWMVKYPLWVADYTTYSNIVGRPTYMPRPWTKQTIWQFSADGNNRGREFGVNADDIDLNWFDGSLDELKALLGQPVTPPVTPPPPNTLPDISAELDTIDTAVKAIREKGLG